MEIIKLLPIHNLKILQMYFRTKLFNPFNAELNPICHLLALLESHHILHVSRIRVKKINFLVVGG